MVEDSDKMEVSNVESVSLLLFATHCSLLAYLELRTGGCPLFDESDEYWKLWIEHPEV
jgi:hypothetical protein